MWSAGFIVGSRHSGSSERLLTDDGSGRFVVEVHVTDGVTEHIASSGIQDLSFFVEIFRMNSPVQELLILRENCSSQSVWSCVLHSRQHLINLRVFVDIGCHNWSKHLFCQKFTVRVCDGDQCRLNEVSGGVVAVSSKNDLCSVGTSFCVVDVGLQTSERLVVNDGGEEDGSITNVSQLDLLVDFLDFGENLWPDGLWGVDSGARRAFLSGIFPSGTGGSGGDGVDVSGWMDKVEVLSSAFSDQFWEGYISIEVVGDVAPDCFEGRHGASKVDSAEK